MATNKKNEKRSIEPEPNSRPSSIARTTINSPIQDAGDALPDFAVYSKLHNLTMDDKMENALLRSRIDEQSQLIMILKRRADEAIAARQTYESSNAELLLHKNRIEDELKRSSEQCEMLDRRFYELAANHEEMIKIKDEYKTRNAELVIENFQLSDENKRLFSEAILDRDRQIRELQQSYAESIQQYDSTKEKLDQSERLRKETEQRYEIYLNDVKEKLNMTQKQLQDMTTQLREMETTSASSSGEMQTTVQKLTKEKDELLQLAVSRGKLIQEKQEECKRMAQKVETIERSMQDMKAKFERDAALVSVDHQVNRLRRTVDELEAKHDTALMEFEAYKKHSQGLLQQEKELNARLRHLIN